MTKTKQLEKMFGGKWTYVSGQGWQCDDGQRYVTGEADGIDIDGDVIAIKYVMYDQNGNGQRVYWR
jgi:hypothetical protein